MEILKYKGNDNYIIGIAKEDNQKYIFFAYIVGISLNSEQDKYEATDCFDRIVSRFTTYKNFTLEFLLKENKNNDIFHLIKIEDEKEYDTIVKFLEFIL
jgi:hypothetical protein